MVKKRYSALVLALTAATLAFVAGAGARVAVRAVKGEVVAVGPILSRAEGGGYSDSQPLLPGDVAKEVRDGAELLVNVYNKVKDNYYKDIPSDTPLALGAVRNMIAHLDDPYTNVYTPQEAQEMAANRRGLFHGIGAIVARDRAAPEAASSGGDGPESPSDQHVVGDFVLKVVSPIRGGPAERAGLRPGDVIRSIAVNGKQEKEVLSLAGLYSLLPGDLYSQAQKQRIVDPALLKGVFKREQTDLTKYADINEALAMLSSPDTRAVKLKVSRAGREDLYLTIECAETAVTPVTLTMAKGGVATIAISYFTDDAADRFAEALRSAREQGAGKLVIDLRHCPGGSQSAGRKILGLLLGDVAVAQIENREAQRTPVKAEAEGVPAATVCDVLTDEGTARVAELVAAALRDVGGARLFGERTYGDAYLRLEYDLASADGGGAYRIELASGKMLTTKGVDYAGVGLSPDEIVMQRGGSGNEDLVLRRALEHLAQSGG